MNTRRARWLRLALRTLDVVADTPPVGSPVGHSLWNVRTPYPTAITCRCGRTLYRFGTDLRHRDGTPCSVAKTKAA